MDMLNSFLGFQGERGRVLNPGNRLLPRALARSDRNSNENVVTIFTVRATVEPAVHDHVDRTHMNGRRAYTTRPVISNSTQTWTALILYRLLRTTVHT